MAVASFFPKTAMSAASVLRGIDAQTFRKLIDSIAIGLFYDLGATQCPEGRTALELSVNLLARLYPTLAIEEVGAHALADQGTNIPPDVDSVRDVYARVSSGTQAPSQSSFRDRLIGIARSINGQIAIGEPGCNVSAAIVVGSTEVTSLRENQRATYVGSEGWILRASHVRPVGSGASNNPFGAAAAACIGAASVFTTVFADHLPATSSRIDDTTELFQVSTLDWDARAGLGQAQLHGLSNPAIGSVDIGETYLVGVGAIGGAAAWTLARTLSLRGRLHLVDAEKIEPSNLQRYVLADERSPGQLKVDVGAREFELQRAAQPPELADGLSSQVCVEPRPSHWAEFVSRRGDYRFDRVLLAVDSAADRIAVQASLPRWVANAWTQPENLGVSRHDFLGPGPCVACLYLPANQRKNQDQLVAEAIGAEGDAELQHIRELLFTGAPVGHAFLERTASRLRVPVEELSSFASQSLETFYTQALCGGIVLSLGGQLGIARQVEVPMAFQSALAGVLLAAELVADAGKLRAISLPARTEIDLLRGLKSLRNHVHSPATKHSSGRCICQDEAFRRVYATKYSLTKPGTL